MRSTRVRMFKRSTMLGACVLTVALICTGCAAKGGGSSGQTSVGVTLTTASNAFFKAEAEGIAKEAKADNVKVNVQYADGDIDKQSSQVDAFVRQGVKFIIIDAVDSDGIGPAVLRAKQAGVKVVAIDSASSGSDAAVYTDNTAAGRIVCKELLDRIGNKGTFYLADSRPVTAITNRVTGCKQALADAPDVKVITGQRADDSRDGGLSVGTDALTANPGLNAIFAINDPQAAGVLLAAKQKGNKTVIIGGVDGSSQAIDPIAAGDQIVATGAQHPREMGARGVQLGLDLLKGKKQSAPELMAPQLITKDTAKDYTKWD